MTDKLHAPPLSADETASLLAQVLEVASATENAIVAFDLDSTLLDNRPRQSRIMREYGREHGVEQLTHNQPEHWNGWDAKLSMRNTGLEESGIDTHFAPFREYWFERFFTSEYCVDDVPVPGGPEFAAAIAQSTAQLYYVTGRHEEMRAGSVACFERVGLPVPNDSSIQLLMKPTLDESDDDYKLRTYAVLREHGSLVAAFDNEPAHINGYKRAFPDAHSIHLATDHSPRSIRVLDGIPSIPNFTPFRR